MAWFLTFLCIYIKDAFGFYILKIINSMCCYCTHIYSTVSLNYRHAIYANRLYLSLFEERHPEYLATNTPAGPQICGAVRIHPSAQIHPSAVVSSVEDFSLCFPGAKTGVKNRSRVNWA